MSHCQRALTARVGFQQRLPEVMDASTCVPTDDKVIGQSSHGHDKRMHAEFLLIIQGMTKPHYEKCLVI